MERFDLFGAQAFDIEGFAGHEMLEALDQLRIADQPAGTAPVGVQLAGLLVMLAHGRTATDRTFRREIIGIRPPLAVRVHHSHDLRDDITGALDHDRVADADVLALQLILVVQGGIGHNDTADRDRGQPRNRGQLAGPSHLDVDILQQGRGLFGREFVRDGPAWLARVETHALLPVQPVHLVDHAVNVITERGSAGLDIAIDIQHGLDGGAGLHQRIDREPHAPEGLDRLHLGLAQRAEISPQA